MTAWKLDLQRIDTDFRGGRCFTHARGAVSPDGAAIITTQPLRLSGSDIFYGLHCLTGSDGGRSWSKPAAVAELARRPCPEYPGCELAMIDATPFFHRATGRFLLTGMSALYRNDEFLPEPRPRQTVYSSLNPETGRWRPYRLLAMPETEGRFFCAAAGCTQICELPDGDLLIPFYFISREEVLRRGNFRAAVMRCSFDGETLRFRECGTPLGTPAPRGFYEPSVICHGGRFYLTLRNDVAGYVAAGEDGLHYSEPLEWRFDDGALPGNYNTQQHWISGGGRLYLVYTRRGAENDHIFRHRAPLFIAEVDPETLRLRRDSERIAVPERGARLGNFGCARVSGNESWIVVSEWMQSPDGDYRRCAERGSDNSIFVARIRFGE